MKPSEVPSSLVAALPRGVDATWSHLPGLGRGAWRVRRADGADLVVRQAGEAEELAARAAADVAVGPVVVASAEGWLATEYLDGAGLTGLELGRPVVLDELAVLLRRLHSCDLILPEAPMADARHRYVAGLSPTGLPDGLLAAVAEAERVELDLSSAGTGLVPAHLDVVANLLMTRSGLRLIDFEYAAAADPARELGQVIWEAEVGRGGARRLVSAYGKDVAAGEESAAAWAWVTGVTWTAWALCQPDSPVLRRFGLRSWERLRNYWWRPAR